MDLLEHIFWILVFIIGYTYIGYGLLLGIMVHLKRAFRREGQIADLSFHQENLPEITLLVPAYNEADFVKQKMKNTRGLIYPTHKLHQIWVTDGSDDGTPELLRNYPDITVIHDPKRNGKIAAMNRGMKLVKTPLVVFTDANTLIGQDSLIRLAALFQDPGTGCVSGEKRISMNDRESASSSGEGIYWKYESLLKKWDAELSSVVGAAGELFAIRTSLYSEVEPDTLLDDFMISMRIAMQGFSIQYDPAAYAIERASISVKEEMKRKVRIAAGGIQSVLRLGGLLNVFRFGTLSFQYFSHRVLRWTLAPLSLLLVLPLNVALLSRGGIYIPMLLCQIFFYGLSLLGWILERQETRIKILFVPYYFTFMNYSVLLGLLRYIRNKQGVNWERAQRA